MEVPSRKVLPEMNQAEGFHQRSTEPCVPAGVLWELPRRERGL